MSACAREDASRATRERVARLEDGLDAMKAAVALRPARVQEREYHTAYVAFQLALVEATGNPALVSLVRRIDGALLAAPLPARGPTHRRTRDSRARGDPRRCPSGRRGRGAQCHGAHLDTVEQYLHDHARRVARAA